MTEQNISFCAQKWNFERILCHYFINCTVESHNEKHDTHTALLRQRCQNGRAILFVIKALNPDVNYEFFYIKNH